MTLAFIEISHTLSLMFCFRVKYIIGNRVKSLNHFVGITTFNAICKGIINALMQFDWQILTSVTVLESVFYLHPHYLCKELILTNWPSSMPMTEACRAQFQTSRRQLAGTASIVFLSEQTIKRYYALWYHKNHYNLICIIRNTYRCMHKTYLSCVAMPMLE